MQRAGYFRGGLAKSKRRSHHRPIWTRHCNTSHSFQVLRDALTTLPRRPMNYRHAFHAGNFADCMKHALLVWLLRALMRKPAALFVLDTHAGAGRYDLDSGPAERTGEWQKGIAKLLDDTPPPLADYVGLVRVAGPVSRLAHDHPRPASPR